jgi:hypothetical protein
MCAMLGLELSAAPLSVEALTRNVTKYLFAYLGAAYSVRGGSSDKSECFVGRRGGWVCGYRHNELLSIASGASASGQGTGSVIDDF